jgi:hypothetical protein
MYETLTVNIVGAFKSPRSAVCLYVDDQAGFDYITLQKGKWVSEGSLRPEVVDWLMGTDRPTAELGPNWTNIRLNDFPLGKMELVIHYNSIHHRDER